MSPLRLRHSRNLIALAACGGALAGAIVVVSGSAAGPIRQDADARASVHASASSRRAVAAVDRRARSHPRSVPAAGPTGARGKRGPAGDTGPVGPVGPDLALPLTLNWSGSDQSAGNDTTTGTIPGIAAVSITCNPTSQSLVITPASSKVRTVADVTTFQGEGTAGVSSYVRLWSQGGTPIVIALPTNGMLDGTLSVEPVSGDGGAGPEPWSLTFSSDWILNDPDGDNDHCFVAGQFLH